MSSQKSLPRLKKTTDPAVRLPSPKFNHSDKVQFWPNLIRSLLCSFAVILSLLQTQIANALINGKPLENTPDLVRLVFKDGTMCTGAYIDEFTILTAAHRLINASEVEKILSSDDRPLAVTDIKNILQPKFVHGWWLAFDVGIIKTSKNNFYNSNFLLSEERIPLFGKVEFFGCGIIEFKPKKRARTQGRNTYFRIGSVLFSLGASRSTSETGTNTSIAPNDSGGPIVNSETGRIIAVASQATARQSAEHNIPALSVGTSIVTPENREFVLEHMGRFQD